MKFVNYASYLVAPGAPLEVATAPFPSIDDLADDEIIIKNKAVAIKYVFLWPLLTTITNIITSPIDWKIQSPSSPFKVPFPFILGQDIAGEVLHTPKNNNNNGAPSSAFQKGDRVIGQSQALMPPSSTDSPLAFGGFQLYVKLKTNTVARIPASLSYAQAAVLPLSVSTAAAGLFMRATLGLDDDDVKHNNNKNKTLLLWGGSSSVGSSVVQLAVAAGYRVVATASPANYGYVKRLGAAMVLDYHNPDIVAILAGLLSGLGGGDGTTTVVGAYDAIGTETTVRQCVGVLAALGGGRERVVKRVASVGAVVDDAEGGVEVVRIEATGIVTSEPAVGRRVWGEWVPRALEQGTLKAEPKAAVVGSGLYYLEGALQMNKRGVSAAKVVVSL